MKSIVMGAVLGSLFIFTACQKEKDTHEPIMKEVRKPILEPEVVVKNQSPEEVYNGEVNIERGKKIWLSSCVQCHNRDPNLKGSIGPETVDAPIEVMTSKVMTGKYPDPLPAGFVPKRKTRAMRPLPQFQNDIPSIWAYVQSVKK